MSLVRYQKKRDFRKTPEPKGREAKIRRNRFVVQEHHASRLHFDLRLEMGGVLKSWAVPKGPSLDPEQKRLAVPTEDHPIEYLKFEGRIPKGSYGAGEHMIWDTGTYALDQGEDPLEEFNQGRLNFQLHGRKLRGGFHLVRMKGNNQWLLIKNQDAYAEPGWKLQLRLASDEQGREFERKVNAAQDNPAARAPKKRVRKITAHADQATGQVLSARKLFSTSELQGDARVKIGKSIVTLSNLDKVYWPDEGYTKGDLIRYYNDISKTILPYLKDRPLILKRFPDGINGKSFHQHDVAEAPDYVRTERIAVEGHEVNYIIGDNLPTLLYMANLGAIERHPWNSPVAHLDRPDWVVFDLDPDEVEFAVICELAMSVKEIIESLSLECFAKTSGSRGLHVYVPIKPVHSYEEVADFAARVAARVVEANPEIATIERSLQKRQRKQIYVDAMQNARGKSVVAPYSVRPRPGATVSAPLEWREVKAQKITPQDFTIKNIPARVARKSDLFRAVLKGKQTLTKALAELIEGDNTQTIA
jgi:bifunctional non-homologous end joining protein LigD